ncbi:serine/threonine-protein kinase [Mycolicibacterium insubricum]|uniref:serine/threonine-protein kinase n=1 Tax=Mycolicibacterium insubricum TaxID=444597 RepID=UPI0021F33060|nr:serine/threonine-protein kinase [Mycolicibacterium insubricum]MCV7080835.1 serine/threonine protein kinase [Mycolicibacterium insubricum]
MAETALGRYRLVEQLDRNESTQVFRGHDTVTDREVTVVRLVDDASRQRFFDGARLLASLDDPHVPAVLDIDDEYFVTRPVAGRSLMADGLLSPQRAVAVLEQVGDAVDAAHAVGLVHGEIRPANITVGKRDFAMLTGFAHGSGPSSVGRFAYLAPERFEAGDATVAGDVYALACVLFECLTGRTPYAGDTLEQQITGHLAKPAPRPSDTGVPAAFDAVIATGLAKDPAVRFGSAGALLDAARAALSGMVAPEPVAPPPPAPAPTEPASARGWASTPPRSPWPAAARAGCRGARRPGPARRARGGRARAARHVVRPGSPGCRAPRDRTRRLRRSAGQLRLAHVGGCRCPAAVAAPPVRHTARRPAAVRRTGGGRHEGPLRAPHAAGARAEPARRSRGRRRGHGLHRGLGQ